MVIDRREVGPPPENGGPCPECGGPREKRTSYGGSEAEGRKVYVTIRCTACGHQEQSSQRIQ